MPVYRSLVTARTSLPPWCKTIGLILALAGLLTLVWSDGYGVPGLLVLAGLLVYFIVPPVLIGWVVRRGFPAVAGVWRFELDDTGVTWAIPSLRMTAGWQRVVAVDDRPDMLLLVLSGRNGVVPLLKSAFGEADRERLAAFCRDRISTTAAATTG